MCKVKLNILKMGKNQIMCEYFNQKLDTTGTGFANKYIEVC